MKPSNHNAPDLRIEQISVGCLKSNPDNPRTHSASQLKKLRASMREFGLNQPILIDQSNRIIAGNARVQAAIDLGMAIVPCIRISHLSAAQRRAYVIADNKIAELGDWDQELLITELKFLAAEALDFDLEITGFETAELDFMILGEAGFDNDPDADLLIPETKLPPTTQPGDLWLCGPHRVLCGNARVAEDYKSVMADCTADMVFTDPPYNVPVNGHVRMTGTGHAEFSEASGEMACEDFTVFLNDFMKLAVAHSRDGALHYICMDWRHQRELLEAAYTEYTKQLNMCVWNKTNGGMGSFYRSKHELVFVWKVGTASHLNTIALGKHGRYRTNVWDYAGVNTFGANREADLADHPTVKPVDMVMDAILDCTMRGQHVLDPFLGSGTTLLAAERCGRIAHGIEKDPAYVDVALRRWQAMTGDVPRRVGTDQPWCDPLHNNGETTHD